LRSFAEIEEERGELDAALAMRDDAVLALSAIETADPRKSSIAIELFGIYTRVHEHL
jgi:hypothetical protein